MGYILIIFLLIGYLLAVLVTKIKLKSSKNNFKLIENKSDFIQCVFLWPLVLIGVIFWLFMNLIRLIPWPVYKDLSD